MQLQTIRSRVKGYLGNRSDANNTIVDEYVNNAYREMSVQFFFDELDEADESITTVSGTAIYAIPSTLYVVESAYDITNNQPLILKDIDWYDQQDQSATGTPEYIIVYEDNIILFPKPDDEIDIRLRGKAVVTALNAITDEPVFPEDWHLLLCMYAAADLAFYFGMDARGMTVKNEYLSKVAVRTEKRTFRRRKQQGQIDPGRRRKWRDNGED